MFNIYATAIFFPLEITTGFLHKSASALTEVFKTAGGFEIVSPLNFILKPISVFFMHLINNNIVLIILALVLLFFALSQIVKSMKGMIIKKVEAILNQYLFRNTFISLLLGLVLTATIQSSSITTSIIIPLVAAGVLTIEQIFPYTLGANIGTTVTAILAALAIGKEAGLAIAFAHMLFNIFGTTVFLPLRIVPIATAKFIAKFAAVSKKNFFIFLTIYILLHTALIIFIFI